MKSTYAKSDFPLYGSQLTMLMLTLQELQISLFYVVRHTMFFLYQTSYVLRSGIFLKDFMHQVHIICQITHFRTLLDATHFLCTAKVQGFKFKEESHSIIDLCYFSGESQHLMQQTPMPMNFLQLSLNWQLIPSNQRGQNKRLTTYVISPVRQILTQYYFTSDISNFYGSQLLYRLLNRPPDQAVAQ